MKIKSNALIALSIVAVILSAIVSLGKIDLYLAGTQWMLVAIVLGIYAIYEKKN